MSFTNEELARLKDGLSGNPGALMEFESGWLDNFIARLECSERLNAAWEGEDGKAIEAARRAWREAAGLTAEGATE